MKTLVLFTRNHRDIWFGFVQKLADSSKWSEGDKQLELGDWTVAWILKPPWHSPKSPEVILFLEGSKATSAFANFGFPRRKNQVNQADFDEQPLMMVKKTNAISGVV